MRIFSSLTTKIQDFFNRCVDYLHKKSSKELQEKNRSESIASDISETTHVLCASSKAPVALSASSKAPVALPDFSSKPVALPSSSSAPLVPVNNDHDYVPYDFLTPKALQTTPQTKQEFEEERADINRIQEDVEKERERKIQSDIRHFDDFSHTPKLSAFRQQPRKVETTKDRKLNLYQSVQNKPSFKVDLDAHVPWNVSILILVGFALTPVLIKFLTNKYKKKYDKKTEPSKEPKNSSEDAQES
uniref:Uncharacterized protein n=1 Tax=Nephroselmis olivacea TaxID=31312 RepID=Q9T3L7_NEPOL|nr:hypothetical protein NeolCp085 [Nephroselmis olivacea]NP_050957.1 hypothetical protein NeolCp152 [Nephroselmis olivacea]AAD54861.1 unknown [Nephroselmis olivacea]AAD54928.1 unknown [Nephroselmis olivacea]